MGKGIGDLAVLGGCNWLCRSHLADSPSVVLSVARQSGTHPRLAVEVMLNKEVVVRQLDRTEVLWLLYTCQSRALGKKVAAPEFQVGMASQTCRRLMLSGIRKGDVCCVRMISGGIGRSSHPPA